jgi:hypothetical protein
MSPLLLVPRVLGRLIRSLQERIELQIDTAPAIFPARSADQM